MEIHKSIANREYSEEEPIKLSLPAEDAEVRLESPQGNELLELTALLNNLTSEKNAEKVYGFRLQKHLQRLAMASALKDGRDVVTQADVDYIRSLASCINLEYYAI